MTKESTMSTNPVLNAADPRVDESGRYFYCAAVLDYIPREEKPQIFSEEYYPTRVCCVHCAGNCWPEA